MSDLEGEESMLSGEEEGGQEESGMEQAQEGEEENPEEEQLPEEEELPVVPITPEMITECLSLLCKTGDGLAHAYVRLDLHERELTDISLLKTFIHLRYIDVSKNSLKDISALSALTHMLTLKADENLLTSAKMEEMPFLQIASFNGNKISSTEGITHPMLEHLSLNNNDITVVTELNSAKLSRLHTLELRGNRLENTGGIFLPNLRNLFLGANTIKEIEGLENLINLTTLHLRDNQLSNLNGFSENMKMLQYVNLRGNNIAEANEIKKMQCLPMLRALVVSENPLAEEDDYRMEVLIALRKLERLDKEDYHDEERNDAEEIYEQRKADAENAEPVEQEADQKEEDD